MPRRSDPLTNAVQVPHTHLCYAHSSAVKASVPHSSAPPSLSPIRTARLALRLPDRHPCLPTARPSSALQSSRPCPGAPESPLVEPSTPTARPSTSTPRPCSATTATRRTPNSSSPTSLQPCSIPLQTPHSPTLSSPPPTASVFQQTSPSSLSARPTSATSSFLALQKPAPLASPCPCE